MAGSEKDLSTLRDPAAQQGDGSAATAVDGAQADGQAPEPLTFAVPRATSPRPVPRRAALGDPRLFFNRELSWLDFNWRVLYQALDERNPLLERVRFLAITASNLDEFFRKRVGGLRRQKAAGVQRLSPDGRTPEEQLRLISRAVRPMYRTLTETWEKTLKPLLRERAGIHIRDYETLGKAQKTALHRHFMANIFPILTPLAVDPGHPFPFISNLSLSLAVTLRHPTRGTEHFARLKVPTSRGRWVPLDEPLHFVPVEQVIAANIRELFRGMEIVSVHPFRITRNADVRRDEEEADDLIEMIAEELRERRFAEVVRIEVDARMPREVRELLMRELDLQPDDFYEVEGQIDLADNSWLADLDLPEHKFEPWEPVIPTRLLHEGEAKDRPDIFAVIRNGDLLVHHPYESFRASVQRFIEEAAEDPNVLAIKQTLYRTSDESPIVDALQRAAESGKQVAVLVEVKARFDEQNNIEWGQILEKSGVHVTYGLVGLKTHSKTTLVIREEQDGLRAYCHIGTGNYNPKTARLYTDLGLLTCDPDLGYDLINLFHYLTGYSPEQNYRKLIVAPRDMRKTFIQLVRAEVAFQKEHGNGHIIAKMNALDDVEMIQELYRASMAGVRIDLIVRGHCRLRPGLPRFSENIRVISILGRFLEHSRIYYFHNNGAPRVFIGSADWMRRNLDDRVEAAAEVQEPALKARLVQTLRLALDDHRSAWELRPDGHYVLRQPRHPGEKGFQEVLMERARHLTLRADAPWDIR
ncbi:polyphosphate kinase 1 [Rhodocaloribacter litoris]|uniref:polyphosphate kinase 1 n=1 Tax=Rhodocaloribacter litoris TaxID=2558931 RepID=UPI0014243091|nr:polyphosphate kinase 1 [Rhodocaloribacter litoris]QXD15026.1 polyphosphate kinase 1 [Rhodocaloribacter litoris]